MTLSDLLTVITDDSMIEIKLGYRTLFEGYKSDLDLNEKQLELTVEYIWFSKVYDRLMIEL